MHYANRQNNHIHIQKKSKPLNLNCGHVPTQSQPRWAMGFTKNQRVFLRCRSGVGLGDSAMNQ